MNQASHDPMTPWRLAVMLVASTLAAGCSTQVKVSELDQNKLAPGTSIDGIPFRGVERYEIALYRRTDKGYKQVEADKTVANLANLDRLYLLQMQGQPLSQGTVLVKLRSDGTLEKVSVDSKSVGPETLSAIGKGIKDLEDAKVTREKAEADAPSSDEDKRLAALEALQAAELAALELDALQSSATAVQRRTAEQKLTKARLTANQKARRANLSLPFQDAGT